MAIARYKLLKEVDGNLIGSSLLLTPEEGEKYIVKGQAQLAEYLDPSDELDAQKIRHFYNNPTGADRGVETIDSKVPSLEEAVKGITGNSVETEVESTGGAGVDDGADGGEANVSQGQSAPTTDPDAGDDYDSMTVADLKTEADDRGVDLTGKTLKDDIIAALREDDKA